MSRITSVVRVSALAAVVSAWTGLEGAHAQTKPVRNQDSVAFVREFPLALVYEGLARFHTQDYDGAIGAWESYLDHSRKADDSASVTQLIHEAMVRRYPLSLVYEGLALVQGGDTAGAIAAWERFLSMAPEGSDTVSVRRMAEQVFFQQYPMALLYRGMMQFMNHEYQAAIGSWEKYLEVAATEGERAKTLQLIATARARQEARSVVYRAQR